MPKTVLILGGSYAGMHIAHYLLKHTRQSQKDLKVIIVSKNSHFYWNIASVRAIVPNGGIKDNQIFQSLEQALQRYPDDNYELVIGTATRADFAAKTVTITVSSDGSQRSIAYDQLVLATGSRCAGADAAGVPWKASGSYEETLQLLHTIRDRVEKASSIVVAGAGPTGVEVAGELGWAYGHDKDRSVTLLAADADLLRGDSVAGAARHELEKLGVKIRTSVSVEGATTLPSGKTQLLLRGEGGGEEKLEVDLYLPTMGLVPNTDYVDARFLNEKKNVVVDETFRVKGADDVWAAGDVVSVPRAGFFITKSQAAGVAKNIEAALKSKQPGKIRGPPLDILACTTGRDRGVGRAGYIRLLSVMVWLAKGKTLAVQMLPGYIDGSVA